MAQLAVHQHGKNRVRLGRVWREGKTHYMVEWSVAVMLESDMAHAFLTHSNKDMTATDTQKNTVYYVAKQCSSRCSPEEYAIALAKHFVDTYPKVSKAKVKVEAKPWQRITTATGEPHDHGFMLTGTELRTTYVTYEESGTTEVVSGVKDMKVLKTTQSGYEGFLHDKYTVLKDTRERIVATSITSTWRYSSHVKDYDAAFAAVKAAIVAKFYGPAHSGVYSPSVQFTLMEMAKEVISTVPEVESIFFNLPNLHFLPCPVVASKALKPSLHTQFEDDVYIATSEPHGDIEAVVTRAQLQPHAKL